MFLNFFGKVNVKKNVVVTDMLMMFVMYDKYYIKYDDGRGRLRLPEETERVVH